VSILFIGYDLGKPSRDYAAMEDAIEGLGDSARFLQSNWFVDTDLTPAEVRDQLKKATDSDDSLMVFPVGHGWASFHVPKDVTDWLHEHL
jgi:hypothetical protein